MSYFDELSAVALDNLLRHTSEKPRRTNWASFFAPQTAHSVLLKANPLHGQARKSLCRVTISPPGRRWRSSNSSGELVLHSENACLPEMLQNMGSSLVELNVPRDGWLTGTSATAVSFDCLSALNEHCVALKHLDLSGLDPNGTFIEKIIEGHSGRMKSLILPTGFSIVKAVVLRGHCAGLESLAFNMRVDLPHLRTSIDGNEAEQGGNGSGAEENSNDGNNEDKGEDDEMEDNDESEHVEINEDQEEEVPEYRTELTLFFMTVGPTLKELTFSFFHCGDTILKNFISSVKRFCRSITKIETPILQCHRYQYSWIQQSLADLYVSYGAQLEYVQLDIMDPALCAQVVKSCPNVRTSCIGFDVDAAARMKALGSSLVAIFFKNVRAPAIDVKEFEAAAKLCENVRSVHAKDMGLWATKVANVFSNLSRVLIEMSYGIQPSHILRILSAIAKNNSEITEFTFRCDFPGGNAFEELAQNNHLLEKVTIKVRAPDGIYWPDYKWGPYEGALSQMIRSFLGCTKLKELVIIDHGYPHYYPDVVPPAPVREIIADACTPFRTRRTFIHVFGVDYLK